MATGCQPSLSDLPTLSDGDLTAIAKALQQSTAVEHRSHARRPYPVVQSVAPYDGTNLPAKVMFWPVRCHDLSNAGVSFLLPEPPPFQQVVVALGKPPQVTYLTAQITRCDRHRGPGHDLLVGCRFLQRVAIES
jgi:hypothetical protein